ncbi:hypothetical protein [Vibrio coralliilyticus]|uniref:H-NS family histone-like protein n=1 Tax=Vibrio coralliilyticus TaxID=190893 RepID=UPI000C169438|nr:hypothetical protein [Vibrio coralliilyticus]
MNLKDLLNVRKLKTLLKDASANQISEIIKKLESIQLERIEAEELAEKKAKEEEEKIRKLREEVLLSGVDLEKMISALSKEKTPRKNRTTHRASDKPSFKDERSELPS